MRHRLSGVSSSLIILTLFVATLLLVGCTTVSDDYAGVNSGTYTNEQTGEAWDFKGGKDGTGVSFEVTTNPDGTKTVKYSAENLDATSRAIAAAEARQKRLDKLTDLLINFMAAK